MCSQPRTEYNLRLHIHTYIPPASSSASGKTEHHDPDGSLEIDRSCGSFACSFVREYGVEIPINDCGGCISKCDVL